MATFVDFLSLSCLSIIIVYFCLLLYVYSAAIQAIAAYLDAFQKIADAATNSRGKFKSRKHKKKPNETLPTAAAPRNCGNCARTVRNIRYISYIHLLFMRLPSDGDSDSDSDASVNDASVIDLILHISRLYPLGRVESNRLVLLQLTHFSFSLFIFIYWTPHARLFLFFHSFSLIMQCRLTWAGSYRLGSGLEGEGGGGDGT